MSDPNLLPPAAVETAVADSGYSPAVSSSSEQSRFQRWVSLNNPFVFGLYITLGGLVAIALGLAFTNLSTVVIYIALALFVALGLEPAVGMLQRRKVSRTWSIVIVYSAFAIVIIGILLLIVPTVIAQVATFIRDIPSNVAAFKQTEVYAWLTSTWGDPIETLTSEIVKFISDPANIAAVGGGLLQFVFGVGTAISGGIIVIVLSLYFLASMVAMKQSMYQLAPARSRAKVADITDQITGSIGGYLMGMVTLAFLNATFTFLMFTILQLPFALLMGFISFCITIIPLVGPVLFWIIGSIVALFLNPVAALVFAAAYLVYMQIEAYVLTPRVMNKAVSVPGSLVVIGALVGGTLLGLLGALVAVPVTASILLIIKQVVIPRQDAKL